MGATSPTHPASSLQPPVFSVQPQLLNVSASPWFKPLNTTATVSLTGLWPNPQSQPLNSSTPLVQTPTLGNQKEGFQQQPHPNQPSGHTTHDQLRQQHWKIQAHLW